MIDSLFSALQFLTILPVRIKKFREKNAANSMIFFPFTGLLLGLFLIGINKLFYLLGFPCISVDIILAVSLIAITGGMHLDGLSDSADAFLSGKPKDEMLAIMRDSHAGVMGILSIICALLLKIALLYSISAESIAPALLLMCLLGRWSSVFMTYLFPYARVEGKAKVFTNGINAPIFIISTLSALIFAFLIWGMKGLVIFLVIAGAAYVSGKFITRKIGGITGDTLGAAIELSEVIALFCVSVM